MNHTEFKRIYGESRNGANGFVRHPLARSVIYSDGVQDVAETGIYWALDIFATELPKMMRQHDEHMLVITIMVQDSKAHITATGSGDKMLPWSRVIDWTDMPDGDWIFYMSADGDTATIILPSEY